MSSTSRVCAQVWSKADRLRRGLGLLATQEELPAGAAKNSELGSLLGDSLTGWGWEKEEWGFLD